MRPFEAFDGSTTIKETVTISHCEKVRLFVVVIEEAESVPIRAVIFLLLSIWIENLSSENYFDYNKEITILHTVFEEYLNM